MISSTNSAYLPVGSLRSEIIYDQTSCGLSFQIYIYIYIYMPRGVIETCSHGILISIQCAARNMKYQQLTKLSSDTDLAEN